MARQLSERGAGVVYTREWVADLMLDLVGYTTDQDLGAATIVEPGCGDGAFLRRIIPRLLVSARARGRSDDSLLDTVRGYELTPEVALRARETVRETLVAHGVDASIAAALAKAWVVKKDFLLGNVGLKARWVVGNPPYVRVEEASPQTYAKYRQRWTTMAGRADIYIGFYEAGLSLLEAGGRLCFICADRWMHNQYGAGLRRHIIEDFALRAVIEVHESDVFDVAVAAYPAITLIERANHSSTALATAKPSFGRAGASALVKWVGKKRREDFQHSAFSASELKGRFRADESWPSGPPERLRLIADLEAQLPSLSEVGVRIGVGLATGADKVYVVNHPGDIEEKFVKKAVGPADIRGGVLHWTGRYVISPWDGDELADLRQFRGLAAYFRSNRTVLESRYVGRRNPNTWWRTIDRPPADGYVAAKLVVADINDRIEPVLDVDGHWPLHSAYYITSAEWELDALGGYLLSDVASAFVEAYSVKMANGHLRISGQYLKKIRIPWWSRVPEQTRNALSLAFATRDRAAASKAVANLLAA